MIGHSLFAFKFLDKKKMAYKYPPNKYKGLKFKQIKFCIYLWLPNSE
jgi:hypothetical protein